MIMQTGGWGGGVYDVWGWDYWRKRTKVTNKTGVQSAFFYAPKPARKLTLASWSNHIIIIPVDVQLITANRCCAPV